MSDGLLEEERILLQRPARSGLCVASCRLRERDRLVFKPQLQNWARKTAARGRKIIQNNRSLGYSTRLATGETPGANGRWYM